MEFFRNLFDRRRRTQVAFWNLVEQAEDRLRNLDAANQAEWDLGNARRLLDAGSGIVRFERPEAAALTAQAHLIGTLGGLRPVWRWAWASPALAPALARSAARARAYGEQEGLERLTTPGFACTLVEAWGLVAVTCLLSGARGAWCEPTAQGLVFFAFDAPQLAGLDLHNEPPKALGYGGQ